MIVLALSITASVISVVIVLAVLFRDPRRLANISFSTSLLASAVSLFGDTMSAIRPDELSFWKTAVFVSEAVMAPSWLLFTLSFARSYTNTLGRFSKLLIILSPALLIFIIIPQNALFYSPEFESEKTLFLGNAGYFFNLLLLFYSIVSIVDLEATMRSSSGTNRWQIKYMLLGVGGILGLNIFYYSHALLYRSLDMSLLPVRICVFLIFTGIISYSILKRKFMDVEIVVSRGIFYRTLSVFVVGFYLLGLGLIGEGMRYFGPHIGKNIMTFLGFAGAIAVLTIILSEQLRKKVVVFVNKNFYSQKYDYRAQWLQFTQKISAAHSHDDLLISIAEGFREAIGSRGASIWLNETGNGAYFCAKTVDADLPKGKPGMQLIRFLCEKGWVVNVNDEKCKSIVAQDAAFITDNRVSLVVPLLNKNDLIGFIILLEGLAGNDYNYEDYDLLKVLARQAVFAVMNSRLTEELAESRAIEAAGKLSSFIMHDLKNAASMLSLISQNAKEHMDNPEFQRDAMRSVSNTSEKIKGLMQKLKDLPQKINMRLELMDLGTAVQQFVNELSINGKLKIAYELKMPVSTMFDKEEIRKVVINLILNAADATGGNGVIKVSTGIQDGKGFIKISDNGPGMSKEFMETRLFKPFQTTKEKGLGVGLYHCKTIVEAHSGKMAVRSSEGSGTDFIVYLPIRHIK
ncbi:MAG: PEP-CTERM system histidine kinase PrsK [Nitrospirae bacterium]|nr:PEP-CTERM system histidine kinase PrsK [Nitrospirota bacterium]